MKNKTHSKKMTLEMSIGFGFRKSLVSLCVYSPVTTSSIRDRLPWEEEEEEEEEE